MNKTVIAILIGLFLISISLYIAMNMDVENEIEEVDEDIDTIEEEENNVMGEDTENSEKSDEKMKNFVSCLEEAGLVIYGSATCPACTHLVNSFGGREIVDPIYVECMDEGARCAEETKTNYVPEIQIEGEVYEGGRDFNSLGEATGCSY